MATLEGKRAAILGWLAESVPIAHFDDLVLTFLRSRLLSLLLLLVLVAGAGAVEPRDLSPVLEKLRAEHQLPACAAAVMEGGKITAIGAVGVRRADQDVRVTTADVWHTGSCTKSMTAALVGVMVDAGKLRWEQTVADALAGMPCDPAWRKITVWDVVTHRAGVGSSRLPPSFTVDPGRSPGEERVALARALLSQPPPAPTDKSIYSNAGYGLLGAILERASGESYEAMLRRHLFAPLALKTAGFGAAATLGQVDQPWGHRRRDGRLVPVEPTPANHFPVVLAPAGSVHLSLEEFARYAAWFSSNEPRLVTPETFTRLHTPPEGGNYAGGAWESELPGIGGKALCHLGHMGGSFAIFYAGRDRDLACVSVFNTEGNGWEWLGDVIVEAVLKATPRK